MLTENDRAVLDEMYHACVMGTKAINAVIHKVTDEKLALELNRQACKYSSFSQKVSEKLAMEYETPKGEYAEKAMLRAGMQLHTLKDTSTEHVAELLIRENAMAVTELMRSMKANKNARKEYIALADTIMDFQEKCIESLKAYLQ